MNITVYCGSMCGYRPSYAQVARRLGTWMAENGHTLVYGGGCQGLMGELSGAVLRGGGKAIGVIPHFLATPAQMRTDLTQLIEVDTMAVRRTRMIELGDAFLALPGGTGTLEEISEIMSRIHLNLTAAPCVLLSTDGFYDSLEHMVDKMVEEGFLSAAERKKFTFAHTLAEGEAVLDA